MVKGITKQVIVVKGTDSRLFEQAIFLIKDSAVSNSNITEETLLQEAKAACKRGNSSFSFPQRLLWSTIGGSIICILWALAALL